MIQMQQSMRRARTRLKPEPQPEPPALPPSPPAQPAKPEHHPLAEFVDQPMPLDHRVLSWMIRQIETPYRVRRLLSWAARGVATWYGKLRGVVVVLTSRKVQQDTFDERQAICDGCPENDGGYCRACRCWKWALAKLIHKNWRLKWLCPLMKHPGKYPRYGCPGCGQARQSVPTAPGAPGRQPRAQSPVVAVATPPVTPQQRRSGCGGQRQRATIGRGNGQSEEILKG